MIDRLKRVHVHNVSVKIVNVGKGLEEVRATIQLVDEKNNKCGEMDWKVWCNGGRDALIKGEW
jgi:hypothetical protein